MKRATVLLLATAALLAVACADTTPPPVAAPQGEDRYIIDPRTGQTPASADIERRFEAAWRFARSGDHTEARRRLADLTRRAPGYVPAVLAGASMDIQDGQFEAARRTIDEILARDPEQIVARVYEAEIAYREHQTRRALDAYRAIAARPDAPSTARERVASLEGTLFNELVSAAGAAADPAESIRLYREALTFNPSALEPRIALAQRLLALRNFDEARRELGPVLDTGEVDRPEVQEMLAEIDFGRGRYQEAIVRYDRLARRTREPRYTERLEVIKEEWSMANMPSHFRQALESSAVTRADLSVLLYWSVPSIRFAQNLGSPPIAIDIENVPGREEIIRAIAIGLLDVDPVTRRVGPFRAVTAERLSRHLARVLTIRGASCTRGLTSDRVLAACGVSDPLATLPPDATISGRETKRLLEQVAKALQ